MSVRQEEFFDFQESLGALRRRKGIFALCFAVVFGVGLVLALTLPPTYRSEARVLVERQQIPTNLVSTTVTGYVQERIEVLSQRALTREKLTEIGLEVGLIREPANETEEESEEYRRYLGETIATMRESVFVEMVDVDVAELRTLSSVTVAFIVAFEHSEANMATSVTRALTDLFLSENTSLRVEQAGRVADFLGEAAERVRKEIADIESQITQIKEESFDFLPEQLTQARATLTQLEANLVEIDREVGVFEAQRGQLVEQLGGTSRHVVTERGTVGEFQDPRIRLEKAQIDLRAALETFTEEHPDVRRLKQLINELKTEVASGNQRSGPSLSAPTNPEYLRLQAQLNDLDARLTAARNARDLMRQRIGDMTRQLVQNPGVELKYNSLLRDLERAQNEFKDIRDRQYQAELAKSLEAQDKGERFTLLSAASRPTLPVSPNRIGIGLLAAFFGILCGSVGVMIAEAKDEAVRSARDIERITGQKPIGVIPVIDLTNV